MKRLSVILLVTVIMQSCAPIKTQISNQQIHNPINLRHKIGQMIMVGFQGTSIYDEDSQAVMRMAQAGQISGLIFYSYNLENPPQIKRLLTSFKQLKLNQPLFLGIDQEYGSKVRRLSSTNGFTDYHNAFYIGQNLTPQQAENYYHQGAKMVAQAGFNLVFAPDVDLHRNPRTGMICPVIGGMKRSFSSNPQQVSNFATAFIRAHHHHHLLTSIKHFPGHGYATKDSHKGLVDITNCWSRDELVPFRNLINQGYMDLVMTAHLIHRKMDSQYPATLSPKILQTLLRNELKYRGVVISDDLQMGAIDQYYTLKQSVIQAIQAGCDILLFSTYKAHSKEVKTTKTLILDIHEIIIQAIQDKQLTEDQINASYQRILALKKRLKL